MQRRKNRGVRKVRRENVSLRSSRSLRLFLIVLIVGAVAPRPSLAQAQPTFTKDIAPIVWSRCATCHRPGEIGPFSLITYDDVKRRLTAIARVTARPGVMPPWKPVGQLDDFEDDRRLRPNESALIRDWIAAGAPEGDPRDLPPRPTL